MTPSLDASAATSAAWSVIPQMSGDRYGLSSVAAPDGTIWAIGGGASNTSGSTFHQLATVNRFDPLTDTWLPGPKMPEPLATRHTYLAGAAVGSDGRVYVAGGLIGGVSTIGESAVVYAYSFTTMSWSKVASMNDQRRGLDVVEGANGRVYAIGGVDASGTTATVEAYAPATNTWTYVASMSTPRYLAAATEGADGRIYVMGGLGSAGVLATAEVYDPVANTWTSLPQMHAARYGPTATANANGAPCVLGGFGNAGYLNSVECFNSASQAWAVFPSMNKARQLSASATDAAGVMFVLGGVGPGSVRYRSCEKFS